MGRWDMKKAVSSEKISGNSIPRWNVEAPKPVMDRHGAADISPWNIIREARCSGCCPSVPSVADAILRMPLLQRRADAMSLQKTRGNRFVQWVAVQAKLEPNRTGMPDRLKEGIEALSGLPMDAVRVHYNSDKPVQLEALANTQGTEIHIGPGQERHLAHEAWHVVQQAEGGVRLTRPVNGVGVNNDPQLETEADEMGYKAMYAGSAANNGVTAFFKDRFSDPQSTPAPFSIRSRGLAQPADEPIQAIINPINKPSPHDLDDFIKQLEELVLKAANQALVLDQLANDSGGRIDRWIMLATEYLANPAQPNSFLYPSYGYAVETLANQSIQSLALPVGWHCTLQANHGTTVPDMELTGPAGEKAWLDITSTRELNHIRNKVGSGWKNSEVVAEILYVSLVDRGLGNIRESGNMYHGIKARRATKNFNLRYQKAIEEYKGLVNTIMNKLGQQTPPSLKNAFDEALKVEFSHNMIRSSLELAGFALDIYPRNDRNGRDKASIDAYIMERLYPATSVYK
jgi:hypothetical protein